MFYKYNERIFTCGVREPHGIRCAASRTVHIHRLDPETVVPRLRITEEYVLDRNIGRVVLLGILIDVELTAITYSVKQISGPSSEISESYGKIQSFQ